MHNDFEGFGHSHIHAWLHTHPVQYLVYRDSFDLPPRQKQARTHNPDKCSYTCKHNDKYLASATFWSLTGSQTESMQQLSNRQPCPMGLLWPPSGPRRACFSSSFPPFSLLHLTPSFPPKPLSPGPPHPSLPLLLCCLGCTSSLQIHQVQGVGLGTGAGDPGSGSGGFYYFFHINYTSTL